MISMRAGLVGRTLSSSRAVSRTSMLSCLKVNSKRLNVHLHEWQVFQGNPCTLGSLNKAQMAVAIHSAKVHGDPRYCNWSMIIDMMTTYLSRSVVVEYTIVVDTWRAIIVLEVVSITPHPRPTYHSSSNSVLAQAPFFGFERNRVHAET